MNTYANYFLVSWFLLYLFILLLFSYFFIIAIFFLLHCCTPCSIHVVRFSNDVPCCKFDTRFNKKKHLEHDL